MFGTEPTPFDLRMIAFRIPIRVHPSFWIAGVLLSWSPNHPDLMLLWVLCMFISILVHELGHAVMAEAFGWPSEVLLYWCGGLAFSNRHHNRTHWRDIAVSLAGPFAGFGLFAITAVISVLIKERPHPIVAVTIFYLIQINLFWGIVNLLPVYPLDGGQVCLSLVSWAGFRNPGRICAQISVLTAGGAAAFFFSYLDQSFGGMLFAMLCLQNLASLQSPEFR
ncbi:MAG: site-2 protease family protein [Planctomycetaceae bacterium]